MIIKKNILRLLFILCSIATFAQHSNKDLIGKWEGTDEANKKGSILFKEGNKMTWVVEGSKPDYLDYKVDFAKTPAPIDIIAKEPNGKTSTLKCLIQFLDANTIKWQIFYGSERSANFDPGLKNSILILKRVRK